jgi:all-trans-retinol dehydrogenase (NAD+)
MIKRKRGHIVAISSALGKTTIPCVVAYCATKHGITGFMNALYDELCAFDEDEYVKLTTAFPLFIATRREFGEILNNVDDLVTKLTPEYCAEKIVVAMLKNVREINLPPGSQVLSGFK